MVRVETVTVIKNRHYHAQKAYVKVSKRGRGRWQWWLTDFYGETITEGGIVFKTRSEAEKAGRVAKDQYAVQVIDAIRYRMASKHGT